MKLKYGKINVNSNKTTTDRRLNSTTYSIRTMFSIKMKKYMQNIPKLNQTYEELGRYKVSF